MPPICIQGECPTPQDCANEGACYIQRVTPLPTINSHKQNPLPTRVGIALVDHDDNVLENGPYFSVGHELERLLRQPEPEPLLVPLLERYGSRVGIADLKERVAAAVPQESSNEALTEGPDDFVRLSAVVEALNDMPSEWAHRGRAGAIDWLKSELSKEKKT